MKDAEFFWGHEKNTGIFFGVFFINNILSAIYYPYLQKHRGIFLGMIKVGFFGG